MGHSNALMRLLRFAIISLSGATSDWHTFTTRHEGVTVSTARHWEREAKVSLAVVADAPLSGLPAIDDAGLVLVPAGPRRLSEEAIELSADLLSVATGHGRSLSSSRFVTAFRAEDERERGWLRGQRDIATAGAAVAVGRLTVAVGESELGHLLDRQDGATLIAEALAQPHLIGRFRELVRFFEMAFSESADRLVPPLTAFLAARPGLGYTKTEVKRWIVRLRGRAVHADRREPLLEVDVRPVVDRMLLAAYDALFNKRTWRSHDGERRDVWTPAIGPLDTEGRWFVLQHSSPTLAAQLYDAFGAYVLDTSAPAFELDEDCWPRRGPTSVTARQPEVEVVPATRLAVAAS